MRTHSLRPRSLLALLSATAAYSVCASGLNDTGQTQCLDGGNALVACSATVGGDSGANPRQDARYGRDAQSVAGVLTKVGGGAAGFDFSKVTNSGTTLSGAAAAAATAIGGNANDWACTKDNVTGLIWEIKTTSGLRNASHKYSWYSAAATNGGTPGELGTDTCGGTLAAAPYNNQCSTQNYVAAVNAAALCGASDWRLPTRKELLTIVHAGVASPSIDAAYFPNTGVVPTWTSSTYAFDTTQAHVVVFHRGTSELLFKATDSAQVRLVRGTQ